jgi:hypothetical protein
VLYIIFRYKPSARELEALQFLKAPEFSTDGRAALHLDPKFGERQDDIRLTIEDPLHQLR